MSELAQLSLKETGERIRRGELSSIAVTEALLQRIESLNPSINCFLSIERTAALSAAERADAEIKKGVYRGALHGVPLAHKDIFHRPGRPVTAGSRAYDLVSDTTATVLERLDAAGAVSLGMLALDELAAGGTGINHHFGACCNPFDTSRITGGSSSGSVAAVAARMAYGSLGSDAGGSIRIPAAFCGVVGLKPTYGRVSRYGAVPRTWSMDCIGPIARTAEDCALILSAIAGGDSKDSTTVSGSVPDYAEELEQSLDGLSIGVLRSDAWHIDPVVSGLLDAAVDHFGQLGARIVPADIHKLALYTDLQQVVVKTEGAAMHGRVMRAKDERLSMAASSVLQEGMLIPANRYAEALAMRSSLLREFCMTVFGELDLLFAPATVQVAPAIDACRSGDASEIDRQFSQAAVFTRFANYLGVPAITVPCGLSPAGMPVGFQLVGAPFSEGRLLNAAYQFQQICPSPRDPT